MLTVYSKNHCSHCDSAKQLLSIMEIPYEIINVDDKPEAYEFLVQEGHRSVPQIYKDGKIFVEGGYQGLNKLTKDEIINQL